jgi:hypothetical protein
MTMRLKDIYIGKQHRTVNLFAMMMGMTAVFVALLSAIKMSTTGEISGTGIGMVIAFGAGAAFFAVFHIKNGRHRFTILSINPPTDTDPTTIYGKVRYADGTERVMLLGTTLTLRQELGVFLRGCLPPRQYRQTQGG